MLFLKHHPATRRLYMHLIEYPGATLILPGYANKIKDTQFLHDHSEIRFKRSDTLSTADLSKSSKSEHEPYEICIFT